MGTAWANDTNCGMDHAPGAGSIAQPVDLQFSTLLLCYNCPLLSLNTGHLVIGIFLVPGILYGNHENLLSS